MSANAESPSGADTFIGRTIAGRFEMMSVLGEGGMGKVYLAKDSETKQLAAVKVVHGKLSGNEEYVARLKQEARTAGRLRHESAVRILAHGETESGEPYLAMEYCPGRSLKEVIAKEKHFGVARACGVIAQMLGAVGAAHKQGIIHRDLKPENIKIAPDALRGEGVKVLDFGVAKFVGGEGVPEMENAVKTKTGIILGTPKYMAPEQIRGEQVDGRADIYSCGAILYELLSGSPPFQAEDVFGYVSKHLKEPVIPLSERCPEYAIPKEVDDLVLWMLEKNPLQRPKDAQQVIQVLDKYARGSSAARLKFMAKVAACWVVPAAAAAAVAWKVVPGELDVTVTQGGGEGQPALEAILPYSLGLVRLHGVLMALGLGIAGTAGVLWQPRLSVAAYLRRLILGGIVILAIQGVALVLGGAPFAALSYAFTGLLVFVAFTLSWPMENRFLRLLFAGFVAPLVAAVLNPVPLRLARAMTTTDMSPDTEFFLRIWRPELWQGGGLHSVGGNALLVVLATGVLVGLGTVFLPKPGRGSAG
jgi:serine/threonine-protein kinase